MKVDRRDSAAWCRGLEKTTRRVQCLNDGSAVSDADLASRELTTLAERFVAQADGQGAALTGPGGLLIGFIRQVRQTVLQVKLAQHVGHEAGDRAGTSTSVVAPKRARRLADFDEEAISSCALVSANGCQSHETRSWTREGIGGRVSGSVMLKP